MSDYLRIKDTNSQAQANSVLLENKESLEGYICCQVCSATFALIDDATVHLLTSHCVVLSECPLCGVISSDPASLQVHMELAHHSVTSVCRPPRAKCHPECLWKERNLRHQMYCIVRKSKLV